MNWYFDVLSKYAVFSGRAHRTEYWMFSLIHGVIILVLGLLAGKSGHGVMAIMLALYKVGVMLPALAVGVRRMHDIGRSGWWLLLPLVNLYFLCCASDDGENEYGPDPRQEID